MTKKDPKLRVLPSPLLKQPHTSAAVMRDVIYALIPATAVGIWLFGLGAMLVVLGAILGSVLGEYWLSSPNERVAKIKDASAILTGLILGLSLPPALPIWMAIVGGLIAIGIGKVVWGGLGQNNFNPAMVGRAFLLAAFPSAMTTWSPPRGLLTIYPSNLAPPFLHGNYDAITAATPLGLMKFQHQGTGLWDLLIGNTAGCVGETSTVLLLLGGMYLLWRRAIDWRIPVGVILASTLLSGVLWMVNPDRFPDPIFTLSSGGLMLGAFYIATDPVTSPITPLGTWIFAIGIGALIVLIRMFGGFPEGVMYAVLLMNAFTPLIERGTQPKRFGADKITFFNRGKRP